MMSKSRWITPNWPKMLISMGVLGVALAICRVCGVFTTAEAVNIFLVGALVIVTAVYVGETAKISKSSEKSSNAMEQQAQASMEMAEMASRPMIIQRPVYKKAMDAVFLELRSDYFSHFEIYNAGNGPAVELEVSLLDKQERQLHSKRVTFLRAGKQVTFQPYFGDVEESKYYLVCEYRRLFSHTLAQTWDQTWLPFEVSKSGKKGEIYVVSGELEFRQKVSDKDRIDAFSSRSKPK